MRQVLDHLTARYTSIKIKKSTNSDSDDDPLRGLRRVNAPSAIDASIVDQVPVKSGDKHIQILLGAVENLEQAGDERASLKYSRDALNKLESMNSMRYPDTYKKEIKHNLKDIIKKSEKLIKEKKL